MTLHKITEFCTECLSICPNITSFRTITKIKLVGISGNTDAAVTVSNGALEMQDGSTITGNVNTGNGGGVYVDTGGMFTMSGGTIGGASSAAKNTAKNGGGVFVHVATFTMDGGTISGNEATGTGSLEGGGGVFVCTAASAIFLMSGGTVYGSSAGPDLANIANPTGAALSRASYGLAYWGDGVSWTRGAAFGIAPNAITFIAGVAGSPEHTDDTLTAFIP